jgi:hypothetical protein
MCWPGRPCAGTLLADEVVKVESGFFLLWDASLLRWLISPGACYWDAHWVRCVPGSPFPRALFTPAFPAAARRSHLPCALPSAQRPHPV